MKYTLSFSSLLAAGVLLTACQSNTMMQQQMGLAPTNGQIIKDIMVADQGEIASAKIAQKRAVSPKVRQFASYLKNKHTLCLQKMTTLSHRTGIKPEESALSADLKKHNAQEVQLLTASSRADFDKTYMDAIVKDHQEALQFLDQSIHNSTNPMLTADLKDAREHVAVHLQKAQHLQTHLHR